MTDKYLIVEDGWAMPDFKRLFDETEELIAQLKAEPQDESRIFAAVYEYLMCKARGLPVGGETEHLVMQYLALAIEGEARSIKVGKAKRRNAMAIRHFLHRRLFFKTTVGTQNPTTECIEDAAKRFGISPGALRKRIERRGLHKKRVKMTADLTTGRKQEDSQGS